METGLLYNKGAMIGGHHKRDTCVSHSSSL